MSQNTSCFGVLPIVSRPICIYGGHLRSKEPLRLARKSVISLIGQDGEIDVSLEQTCSRQARQARQAPELACVLGGEFHNVAARLK